MTDPVRVEVARGVVHLILSRGPNALDVALLAALSEALDHWADHASPALLLSSGHPTVFSPGWDLTQLGGADRDRVLALLRQFNRVVLQLFSYPGPTAVAVDGHAVAGGCLLCLACDIRVMASGPARMGLAELNLGVPVPAPCVRLMAERLSPAAAQEVLFGGDGWTAERAHQLGLVTGVARRGSATADAEATLRSLAAKPSHAFRHTKRFLHARAWEDMAAALPAAEAAVLDAWFDDETRARLHAVVEGLGR